MSTGRRASQLSCLASQREKTVILRRPVKDRLVGCLATTAIPVVVILCISEFSFLMGLLPWGFPQPIQSHANAELNVNATPPLHLSTKVCVFVCVVAGLPWRARANGQSGQRGPKCISLQPPLGLHPTRNDNKISWGQAPESHSASVGGKTD